MREPTLFTKRVGPSWLAWLVCTAALLAIGCDDKKPEGDAKEPAATATPTATEAAKPAEPPAPAPDKLPDVTADQLGIYFGGERLKPGTPEGDKKLKEQIAKYKLADKNVPVLALRPARTGDVIALVAALTDAGVSGITLKTQDRAKNDLTLALTPETKAGKLPDCTVATSIGKDRHTTSWQIRGATATKYPKGMAGPDLTQTLEGITKQVNGCAASTTLIFSGEESVEWAMTFDLVSKVSTAEPPLKISSYVLPRAPLTPGRAVKLAQ